MIVAGVREFREKATKLLRSEEPILIVRRGKVAGLYFPYPSGTLPVEFKRELFFTLTDDIRRRLQRAGIKEENLLENSKSAAKDRRRR